MTHASTRNTRRKRIVTIVGLAFFLLLVALTMNFNGPARLAHAAILQPATTPVLPSVAITNPPNGSLYTLPAQIPLTATATDSNVGATITKVEFYSTSLISSTPTLIGTALTAPYMVTWTPSQASIYTLTARSYDSFGLHATSDPVSVTVQIPAPPPPMPTVTITSPANNTAFAQYTPIPITASFSVANPSSIVKVEFYAALNGGSATLLGTATKAPYTITWTPQQSGSYNLTAKAYDMYGQVETSAPVTVFVPVRDPVPLFVTLTSPANNAVYSTTAQIPITASVSDPDTTATITKVNFYSTPKDGMVTLIGTTTTAPYTITWTAPQPGTYALTAQAYDNYPGDFGISSAVVITVTSVITPTVTPPPAYCQVSYTVVSQWPGGFSTNIVLTNNGTTPINGWTLQWTFPATQQITQLWNGVVTQSGNSVTVTNQSYNGSIPAGGSVTLGFNGSWSGSNPNPPSFTLNGQTCS